MVRLEQAIERGEDSFPSAEEIRAFDGAVRKMLLDLAHRQQRALPGEGQSSEEERQSREEEI